MSNNTSENYFETVDSALDTSNYTNGGVVKMYTEDNKLSYPCIVLGCETLEMFRVEAMKGVLGSKSEGDFDNKYSVYVELAGEIVQIGTIPSTKLKFILVNKIFDYFTKKVYLNKDTMIVGDMLYALCITPMKE